MSVKLNRAGQSQQLTGGCKRRAASHQRGRIHNTTMLNVTNDKIPMPRSPMAWRIMNPEAIPMPLPENNASKQPSKTIGGTIALIAEEYSRTEMPDPFGSKPRRTLLTTHNPAKRQVTAAMPIPP
jgi:hypothetical protein